jgi:lipocalin
VTCRAVALALLSSACATTPLRVADTPAALPAEALVGTWHVVATTFPMWLEGRRTQPTFTYSNTRAEQGVTRFDDTVGYLENGAPSTIDGVDTQHPSTPTHFTWRGRGLLALVSSEWDVVLLDADARWAVIAFTPTLFTPAGLDVIARSPTLDPATLQGIRQRLAAEPSLASLSRSLSPPR